MLGIVATGEQFNDGPTFWYTGKKFKVCLPAASGINYGCENDEYWWFAWRCRRNDAGQFWCLARRGF